MADDSGEQRAVIVGLLGQAIAHHNAGAAEAAAALYRRILDLDPLNADAHNLLGLIHLGRGEIDAAIAEIGTALRIDPDQPICLNNLGNCYLARPELTAAELCFRKAVELSDTYADAWNNLAWVLLELKRYPEAAAALARVLALSPQHERALGNLGRLHLERRDYALALGCYEQVLETRPRSGMAWAGKLGCLIELHRLDEAYEVAVQLPRIDPSRTMDALARKVDILQALGRLDEAAEATREGLAREPHNMDLLFAQTRAGKVDEVLLRQAERAGAEAGKLTGRTRAKLHYTLGKGYEDTGRMPEAARHYAIGAAEMFQETPFDEAQARFLPAEIAAGAAPSYMAALTARQGNPSAAPIFILGMTRSGTTLVEQILATHPDVAPLGEILDMRATLLNFPVPPDLPPTDPADPGSVAGRAADYLERVSAYKGVRDKPHFTDKMLGNYLYPGLIRAMFPRATIIHCRRDPVDTCISNYVTLFKQDLQWTYHLGALGRHYRSYWDLMAHWRRVMPGQFLEIRYEQMVEDQEGMTRKLLAACNLDWDARVLKFYETERPVITASVTQVRRPIYTSSMGRWKKWEPYIAPLLDEIGDLEQAYWQELASA